MIRVLVLSWLLIAAMAMAAAYWVSERVRAAEARVARTERAINDEQERLQLLAAEWAVLTAPDRLERLSADHLPGLNPVEGEQLGNLDDLPVRLDRAVDGPRVQFADGRPLPPRVRPAPAGLTPASAPASAFAPAVPADILPAEPASGRGTPNIAAADDIGDLVRQLREQP